MCCRALHTNKDRRLSLTPLRKIQEMDASGVDAPATAYATAVHAALSAKQHGKMLAVRLFGLLWFRCAGRQQRPPLVSSYPTS